MKIAILTNGSILDNEFYKSKLKDYDLVICADGGLQHAYHMELVPQIAIGDFDSTSPEILSYYQEKGCKMMKHPTMKNETDTELALDYAIDQKPSCIDILAGLGTRLDHSLANVHLLKKSLDQGVLTRIITENNEVMLIDSNIKIKGTIGDGVSLLPLTSSVTGVFTTGLAYPVENGSFHIGKPYGVSNYMTGTVAHIKLKSGLLLVIKYKD